MPQIRKILILLISLLAAILILLYCCQSDGDGKIIARIYPGEFEKLSAYGWVGIDFKEQMDNDSVDQAFRLSPETHGETLWEGNTFWFRPIQAFDANTTYQAQLSGEIATIDGDIFNVDQTWSFTVRDPSLIFYVPDSPGGEIWRAQADGSELKQLTLTGNNVFDFSSDRTGESVAFTYENTLGGRDIWLMDRHGNDQRMLLDCAQDLCSEPAWSTDGQIIAYTREVLNNENGSYQPARVWILNTETGQTNQLYQSEFAYGHSPSFSPDGGKLASYDTINNGIRILNLTSSQESIIPTLIPGSGDWSPDGSKIIFTDLVASENEPHVAVYILDMDNNGIQQVLSEGAGDTDFSQPQWSPDGQRVAVSLRPVNSNISRTLWVLRLDGQESRQVSEDPSATFTAYQWDPWGERLVYQRYDLGSANSSIWLWESGESVQIIEMGSRPQWLP